MQGQLLPMTAGINTVNDNYCTSVHCIRKFRTILVIFAVFSLNITISAVGIENQAKITLSSAHQIAKQLKAANYMARFRTSASLISQFFFC